MYAPTQIVTGGASAAAGSGIGVRRLSVSLDRTAIEAGMDPALIHFDILNTTSGSPDDTWTTADYVTCETAFASAWNTFASYAATGTKPTAYIWHRIGTGVSKPNPAERTMTVALTTAVGGASMPPQNACSITFKTAVRRSWGRTYLPVGSGSMTTAGRLSTTAVDAIANTMNTMVGALATGDFHLVVVSSTLASSLNVETIQVDNVSDIIRRRRYKRSTYKKVLP
jgi:hypothetical protein